MSKCILIAVVSFSSLFCQELKNVKVLPFKTKKEIENYMKKEVTSSLGVKCVYCHDLDDYSSDDNGHKRIAREMIKMVDVLNKDYMTTLKYKPLTCWSCHRGNSYPERFLGDKKPEDHKH